MLVRSLQVGIGTIYALVLGFAVFGVGNLADYDSPFAHLLVLLFLIGVGLHVAVVAISRTWVSGALALMSLLGLFVLLVIALMKVTGDSL